MKMCLLGLGSDAGIIIEGSIILFLLTETVKVQTNPAWPFSVHLFVYLLYDLNVEYCFQVKIAGWHACT